MSEPFLRLVNFLDQMSYNASRDEMTNTDVCVENHLSECLGDTSKVGIKRRYNVDLDETLTDTSVENSDASYASVEDPNLKLVNDIAGM